MNYPRLKQLGIPVQSADGVPFVSRKSLRRGVLNAGMSILYFDKLFGVQTMSERGPYPWDVEAVLERMMSGRRTGTQALMD